MKKKILLSIVACLAIFVTAFSINEVQAATKNHKYLSITIPSAFENDKTYIPSDETDEDIWRTHYKDSNYYGVSFHYDYWAYYSNLEEITSADVTKYVTNLTGNDYEDEYCVVNNELISKGLTYIDGVAASRIRYKVETYVKDTKKTESDYHEVYYINTDHVRYQFTISAYEGYQSYFDSTEYKNMIKSIVIKDTVANTRITPFKDVKTSAWYYNAVKYNWQNKIVNGTSAYTFEPNAKVTRGMVVTMLYSMAGTPSVTAANKFSDVSSSKYYYNAVRWASQNKIVNGYAGTTKFGPNDYVTREQLAVMLSSFAAYKKKYTASNYGLTSFSDASKVSSWALPAMKWAVKNKIISGTNGKLNPKGNATRAEVATMLYSYTLNIK